MTYRCQVSRDIIGSLDKRRVDMADSGSHRRISTVPDVWAIKSLSTMNARYARALYRKDWVIAAIAGTCPVIN
jgi:hypothetical protein